MVELIPALAEDFDDYYAVRCGKSDLYWMGYESAPDREMMRRVFMQRISGNRFEYAGDKQIYMIKADSRNVGFIQFSLSDEGLEFGYSVLDRERGKGYGTAAMQIAIELARKYSDSCFAHIRDDNIASKKAMMKAGLKPTEDVEMKEFPLCGVIPYRKYVLGK